MGSHFNINLFNEISLFKTEISLFIQNRDISISKRDISIYSEIEISLSLLKLEIRDLYLKWRYLYLFRNRDISKRPPIEMSIFFRLQVFCSLITSWSECIILLQFLAICEGVDPLTRPLIIIIISKMIRKRCNSLWVDGGILTKNGGKTSRMMQFSLRFWSGYLH